MISEKERKNRDKLFKLMQENPELPVIPFVDSEICWGDYGSYIGSLGGARVDEYIIPTHDDYLRFRCDDDVFDVLESCLSEEKFDALPWKKAIIFNIYTPD